MIMFLLTHCMIPIYTCTFKDLLLSDSLSRPLASIPIAPWFSSETLALYKSLTYLLTYKVLLASERQSGQNCFSAVEGLQITGSLIWAHEQHNTRKHCLVRSLFHICGWCQLMLLSVPTHLPVICFESQLTLSSLLFLKFKTLGWASGL